ncbi:MAG: hypothetical protein ABIQ94_03120 [Chitinophagaceae bacterium]
MLRQNRNGPTGFVAALVIITGDSDKIAAEPDSLRRERLVSMIFNIVSKFSKYLRQARSSYNR